MKYLVTLALVALALALMNLFARRGRQRRDDVEDMARRATQKAAGVEQTVRCPACGTYRPVSDKTPCSCGFDPENDTA